MYNVTLRCVLATAVVVEVCVFVALGIQYAKHMCHSHLWPAHSIVSFHIIINGLIFINSH